MESTFSYDKIPYPSKFFLQTHPDRLATIATFSGMTPPTVERCRVLELGCGNGSNLLFLAFNLPNAELVGIDLAANHIAYAKNAAHELNLSNTTFHQLDIMKMTADDFGKFDYIIAHGLYSWVPFVVREKILSLCREMLVPNGVGYVSYNAYPGSHIRDMGHGIMRFHAQKFTEPMEKTRNAIAFLNFLNENTSDTKIYQPMLQSEVERHFRHEAADIFHDDLAESYQAFYFHEFAAHLEKNDLKFLSEAEIHARSTQTFAPEVREFLDAIDDVIEREQYLDFLRGRVFRQTLFCHREVTLNYGLEPSILDKFQLTSAIHPKSENPEFTTSKVEKFVGNKGLGIEINHPLTKTALFYLGQIWGQSIGFPELLQTAKQMLEAQDFADKDWEAQLKTARAILFQICFNTDLIDLSLYQPKAFTESSEKPRINALARWQLADANNVATLLNKDIKIEDEVSRHLLELLDGTRNRHDLLTQMSEFIKTSDAVQDKQELLDNLPNWLEDSLSQLARMGMFVS
ncbi:MAG: class I SAM-dependent methyltransferase [Acidobacteriota bacterium]|nr:class I SAM-dependent methyltransferase [Acidobacteriota bacterium]